MKPIAAPVFRPTANCILNSFRNSGKRHLVLTGGRGSGKTTLLAEMFPGGLPGITTWAVQGEGVYLRENETGNSARIGIFDPLRPGTENRMALCREGFETLGIPALRRLAASDHARISVDEIGYLESGLEAYRSALLELLDKKDTALCVRKQDIPFLREICAGKDVFKVDLDRPFGNTGCVIMASGLGKRFGGNKLLADFRGEPMIGRVLSATDGIFAKRVVVTRHPDVAALCRERGVEAVLHSLPLRSDTVRLGIEAMGDMDGCVFCAADQPLLRRDTVAALALAGVNDRESIWRAAHGGRQATPVMFPKWAFGELADLPDGKGGGWIAKKYPERVRLIPVQDEYELMDVDTPEELAALTER